ncbi:MAG TPA: class I SAM-dependent methyltransferase [Rubrobacter sp.]|jgi:SAM-dependent methyltransferase|nr:class I SAM-dependent methyltransferase [Rubrobacter sp.]
MSRKWWFILAAMLLTATLYRNRLRAYLEQASANVRDFDLPSAGAYDALVATVLEGLYARVAGEVGAAHPGGNLLEVGSGPGRLAVRLAREAPGMTLTGVDISDVMVELAARRAARAGLSERVRFEVGDVAVLPLSDEDVDGVVSTSPCTTGRTRPAGGPRSTGSSSPAGRHGSTISPTGCGDLRGKGTDSPSWQPRARSARGK